MTFTFVFRVKDTYMCLSLYLLQFYHFLLLKGRLEDVFLPTWMCEIVIQMTGIWILISLF